jgi:hypothetical protein
MHLITTSGSLVGDPSGHRRGLVVFNKNHRFKNEMMVATTPKVVQPSLVLSLPTTDTTTQKKKIIGFVEEKKFNLEDRLEEEDLVPPFYANMTLRNQDFVTSWEQDTFLVVGYPVLPIYRNISHDEEYLKHLPFAQVLDRIAADLFVGGEKFAKWILDDFVVALVWNGYQVCSIYLLKSICIYLIKFS